MKLDIKVGSGTYGEVFKGTCIDSGDLVALKRIKMERENEGFPITSIREIKILFKLQQNNDNIVFLREIVTCDTEDENCKNDENSTKPYGIGDIFMVFEFVDYDLFGLLRNKDFVISSEVCS